MSPIKQGRVSLFSVTFQVFIHQADRGLAVAGERQIGVLMCVVILSSITINPTHLLPANHCVFYTSFNSGRKMLLLSTLTLQDICIPLLKVYAHVQTFPPNVSSALSVKPQMKRLACGDSWPGPHFTHSCRHHISQLMRSVGGFSHTHTHTRHKH